MSAEWNLDAAVDRIKNAGFDPSRWTDALSYLSSTIGSAGAIVFGADYHVAHAPSSTSLFETMAEYSREGWYERDRRREGVPTMLSDGIITDRDISDTSRASEFYRDFLVRHKCNHFAGVGFETGKDLWCLSMQRSAAQGPFQEAEIKRLRTLWRPLGDAATLTRVLADRHSLTTVDALELVQHAAIICNDRGETVAFNESATRLLGPAYDPKRKSLKFVHSASHALYTQLLAAALHEATSTGTEPISAKIFIDDRRQVVVRAISLTNESEFVFYGARVLLLFKEISLNLKLRTSHYGLTTAEYAIVEWLGTGKNITEIAKIKNVQKSTIRAQLKSIFGKMHVHSQSQLVALIHKDECAREER